MDEKHTCVFVTSIKKVPITIKLVFSASMISKPLERNSPQKKRRNRNIKFGSYRKSKCYRFVSHSSRLLAIDTFLHKYRGIYYAKY